MSVICVGPNSFAGVSCQTCRWWRQNPDAECDGYTDYSDYPGLTCEDIRAEWGDCILTALNGEDLNGVRHDPRSYPQSKALAFDGESYVAGLLTHRTFACNQWQANEVAP